jgi:hypothetical protein
MRVLSQEIPAKLTPYIASLKIFILALLEKNA